MFYSDYLGRGKKVSSSIVYDRLLDHRPQLNQANVLRVKTDHTYRWRSIPESFPEQRTTSVDPSIGDGNKVIQCKK